MSIAANRSRGQAFTLLEIMLAVAILGMMTMTIYRFVASNLTVLRLSTEQNVSEARSTGLIDLITAQLQDLPSGVGALSGEPFKFADRPRDEMTWICGSGPGLVTRYGAGQYVVTMRLQPMSDKSDRMELGLRRKPILTAEGSDEGVTWVPLLSDVQSLQVRYFDLRLNAWVERWPDPSTLPRLVKLMIGRVGRAPMEVMIPLGRTPLQLTP